MQRVEEDLGRRLEWAAVNHYDTDNPHAHVVIRGVDLDGNELRLGRSYISHGLRWRAQELATEELGPQRECEVERRHQREVLQERFTALDKEIARRSKEGRVEIRYGDPSHIKARFLMARMATLEAMRLAEKVGPNTWVLDPRCVQRAKVRVENREVINAVACAPHLHATLQRAESTDFVALRIPFREPLEQRLRLECR